MMSKKIIIIQMSYYKFQCNLKYAYILSLIIEMDQRRFSYKQNKSPSKKEKMNEMTSQNSGKIKQKKYKNKQKQDAQSQQENDTDDQSIYRQTCINWFKKPRVKYFLISWLIFIVAFLVYILIWLIGNFTIQRLSSNYYFKDFKISPFTYIDLWKISNRANGKNYLTDQNYILSNTIYNADQLKKADAVALSLFFSWLMWKLPLTIFTLKMIRTKESAMLKYSTYGFYIILLLLIDIMVTAFQVQNYKDWIFFIIYVFLSIILIILNYMGKRKLKNLFPALKNFIIVILYIVFIYVFMVIVIPAIYATIYSKLKQDAPYLIVNIFPAIDLIFYTLIILMTYFCQHHTIRFIKMFYFVNTGYIVGHLMLISPDQVQFYYLVTYFAIRNISTNWILQRLQKYVIIPVPLFGWIMIYLVSLSINFIPLLGVGNLVVSKSFYSQILQITLPIIRYIPTNQYYIYDSSNIPIVQTFNGALNCNTQLSAVFIIWVILSITQKYHISKPQIKQFFFYIFGIYLFYFGLTTGIQLEYLQANNV